MFRENCSEQNEHDEAESRDESSSVVERVDDDEDDESDDDDAVRDQRKEPELSQLLEEGLDWRPNRFGDLVAGLGVAQEPLDAVAVEDAPVDGDGHQDEEAETVAPLEVLITLENNMRMALQLGSCRLGFFCLYSVSYYPSKRLATTHQMQKATS